MSELEAGTAPAASPAEAVASTPAPEAAPQATPPEAPAEAPASSIEDDLQAVWDKNHAPPVDRDEAGRFKSKNPVEPPPEGKAPATNEGQAPEAASAETASPSIPAPHSWPAEQKAKWEALPPDTREFIAKRESEAHSAISRMGQHIKATQPVVETLEQYRPVFERNGMDYQSGIKALLNAQVALEQNPVAAIQHLANAYGVDLGGLYGGQQGDSQSQPQVAALQAQIAALNRQMQEYQQRDLEQQRAAEAAKAQTLESVVAEFTKDKPDFDTLETEIMTLIPGIRAAKPDASPRDVLTEAYEKAQWMNPTARTQRLEAERKAEEARKAKEAAERATQAKKAASMNVRSQQSSSSDRRTIDEDLAEIARRRYG